MITCATYCEKTPLEPSCPLFATCVAPDSQNPSPCLEKPIPNDSFPPQRASVSPPYGVCSQFVDELVTLFRKATKACHRMLSL